MPAVKGLSLIQPVDPAQLAKDTLRIYEICDGCRRCFNLCPSFNTLLDGIDRRAAEHDRGDREEFRAQLVRLERCVAALPDEVIAAFASPHEVQLKPGYALAQAMQPRQSEARTPPSRRPEPQQPRAFQSPWPQH